MTLLASVLALHLLPAAALKAPPVPAPGPTAAPPEASAPAEPRLPPEEQARYELFLQKCGRCHGTAKALEEPFTAEQWDEYMKKKYRRAGTAITAQQAAEIAAFLRYWATSVRGR